MKNTLLYVAAGLISCGASTALFFTLSRPDDASDAIVQTHVDFNYEDVRLAVEDTILEHQAARLSHDDTKSGRYLAEITASVAELRRQQDMLIAKLEKIANEEPKAAAASAPELSMPDQERVNELVAAAILSQQEKEAAERRERAEKRDREMQESRRKAVISDMTKSYSLTPDQVPQVEAALAKLDAERSQLFGNRRNFMNPQGDQGDQPFDWQTVRDQFSALEKKTDDAMQSILSQDQFKKYQEDRPFNIGRRFGGAGGAPANGPGGGGGGGRQRGERRGGDGQQRDNGSN